MAEQAKATEDEKLKTIEALSTALKQRQNQVQFLKAALNMVARQMDLDEVLRTTPAKRTVCMTNEIVRDW